MEHVRLGIFFPHEIAASFYHFRAGDLFYNMFTGTPEAAWLQVVSMCVFFKLALEPNNRYRLKDEIDLQAYK